MLLSYVLRAMDAQTVETDGRRANVWEIPFHLWH